MNSHRALKTGCKVNIRQLDDEFCESICSLEITIDHGTVLSFVIAPGLVCNSYHAKDVRV